MTVLKRERNLRPLSVSTEHMTPCGVKKTLAPFPGSAFDAGCTVVSEGVCGL